MATSRREFLQTGITSGLVLAAASLPAWAGYGGSSKPRDIPATDYQHPKNPSHLTGLEAAHWPLLRIDGTVTAGQPFNLMIQIGQVLHPMVPEHYIEWMEIWGDGNKLLRVSYDQPVWEVPVQTLRLVAIKSTVLSVRLLCSVHGPWENTINI
jgi:superoxide reductase